MPRTKIERTSAANSMSSEENPRGVERGFSPPRVVGSRGRRPKARAGSCDLRVSPKLRIAVLRWGERNISRDLSEFLGDYVCTTANALRTNLAAVRADDAKDLFRS